MEKKVNGALVEGFLYEGQLRPVAWLDASGAVKATFVYGTRVNVPEYMVTASGTFRFVTDHLGSRGLSLTASGAVAERLYYDEWGRCSRIGTRASSRSGSREGCTTATPAREVRGE